MVAQAAPIPIPGPDRDMIAAFCARIMHPGDIYEVRIPQARRGPARLFGTVAGYFDNAPAVAAALARIGGADAAGVYITLNPVKPGLLARGRNRLVTSVKSTSADADIIHRRLLLIDTDPRRDPADVSASDEEVGWALRRRDAIRQYLRELEGWPDPLVVSESGNGGALLYGIDLPNDVAATTLVQQTLAGLDANFSDGRVKVDAVNYNAARITKVVGTVAAKGEHFVDCPGQADRPWRLATASYPDAPGVVTARQLGKVAAHAPSAADHAARPTDAPVDGDGPLAGRTWTMDQLLAANNLSAAARPWLGGGKKYPLDRCLASADHTAGAALFEMPSGAVVYRCLHDRCADKGWRYLREHALITVPGADNRNGRTAGRGKETAHTAQRDDGGARAQGDAGQGAATRGVWVRMSNVTPRAPRWLWERYLCLEKLNMLAGDPGVGKSYATMKLVAHVTTGTAWPDGTPCPKSRCILLCAEDDEDTIALRLKLLGADLDRIDLLQCMRVGEDARTAPPSLTRTLDIEEIRRKTAETGAQLVLIDPLNAYLEGTTDVKMGPAVRAITSPLAELARTTKAAVVVVAHLNKATMQQALYRLSGSIDFVAAARSVLAVGFEPGRADGRRLLVPVKSNLGALPPGVGFNIHDDGLHWDREEVTTNAATMLGTPVLGEASTARSSKVMRAEQLLCLILSAGPRKAKDIYAATGAAGIGERTVDAAKKDLGVISSLIHGQDGERAWHWTLPPPPDGAATHTDVEVEWDDQGYAQI